MPNDANGVVNETTSGGIQGILGLDQIDWGGQPGQFFACWKLDPCCGTPNPISMLTCCVCWTCCGLCSMSKLFATSVGQDCALIPHCALACCLPCVAGLFTRYNLRRKHGAKGNMVGDFVCACCCGCCSHCQELRSVPPSAWNMLDPWKMPEIVAPDMVFTN